MLFFFLIVVAFVLTALPCPAPACTICGPLKDRITLREELKLAKIIIYGKLANPKLNTENGKGTTDLHIIKIVKGREQFGNRKVVTLDRYVPILDPKNPPRFLVFYDIIGGKLNAYHGRPADSKDVLSYLNGVIGQSGKTRSQTLAFYFQYLNHPDNGISGDAFLEFAKASDGEVGKIAMALPGQGLRRLLQDPMTPSERLGLYAFMLGASGNPKDAEFLRSMIDRPTPRTRNGLDGLLCGYIQLEPKAGWDLVAGILGDPKKGFLDHYAAARVLAFYHNWKPKESRPQILRATQVMLSEPKIADLAVNDLRRWKIWDHTELVLSIYRKTEFDSPITNRAILRYVLCCPLPSAQRFVKTKRQSNPKLIREIEQSLSLERSVK